MRFRIVSGVRPRAPGLEFHVQRLRGLVVPDRFNVGRRHGSMVHLGFFLMRALETWPPLGAWRATPEHRRGDTRGSYRDSWRATAHHKCAYARCDAPLAQESALSLCGGAPR